MQGITYSVDLVLVVDATGSMRGLIDKVKERALSFHTDLENSMKAKDKVIDQLRIRLITYRDFYFDAPGEALRPSPFYSMPAQAGDFAGFIGTVSAGGGGDEPETALEALAEAMRSAWFDGTTRRRQVIVVWTDASAHPLEKAAQEKPAGYPDGPATFDEITDMWEDNDFMDKNAKRMILFAPDTYPWREIADHWTATLQYTSTAGRGLSEIDYSTILDTIANSL